MKPILCNTQVVQNILAGRQTQDRRPIKLPDNWSEIIVTDSPSVCIWTDVYGSMDAAFPEDSADKVIYPKYQPGEILYVRETFAFSCKSNRLEKCSDPAYEYTWFSENKPDKIDREYEIIYRATQNIDPDFPIYWRPSIHMPKWAARIFLRVNSVRVERIQDISPDDILAEGLDNYGWDYAESSDDSGDKFMYWDHTNDNYPKWAEWISSCECIEDIFAAFWDSIYPGSWERNDWVWVYDFEKTEKPTLKESRGE